MKICLLRVPILEGCFLGCLVFKFASWTEIRAFRMAQTWNPGFISQSWNPWAWAEAGRQAHNVLRWRHLLVKGGTAACGRRGLEAAQELVPGGLCVAAVDAFHGRNAYSLSSRGLERPKPEGQSVSEGSLKGLVLLTVPEHSSANSAVCTSPPFSFSLNSLWLHYYFHFFAI